MNECLGNYCNIHGLSWVVGITVGDDSLCLHDQRTSYQHGHYSQPLLWRGCFLILINALQGIRELVLWYYRLHNYEQLACDVNKFRTEQQDVWSNHISSALWHGNKWKESAVKYLVKFRHKICEQLPDTLWRVYLHACCTFYHICSEKIA